jgi:hypothetical protein
MRGQWLRLSIDYRRWSSVARINVSPGAFVKVSRIEAGTRQQQLTEPTSPFELSGVRLGPFTNYVPLILLLLGLI